MLLHKRITGTAFAKQVLLALCASIGYMTIGLVRGFSSPGVPSMKSKSPWLVPSPQIISWISAVPPLGAFLGSLMCGPLMEKLGRKRTLMLVAPFFSASWIWIAYSTDWTSLILGRTATGFCVGIVLPSAQVYVSECSLPKIRGRMGTLPALFLAVGILVTYVGGCWLDWDHLALLCSTFPALLFTLTITLPESPDWLDMKGHTEEAKLARKWLHFNDHLKPGDKKQMEPINVPDKKRFFSRQVQIPLGQVIAVLILQQTCGIDVIIFYTVSIFRASGTWLNEHQSTVIVGVVQLLASFISLFLIDKYGRKPLLIASGMSMGVSMFSLGTYFFLQTLNMTEGLALLPLISLMIFIAGFSIGFCNVPFILMAELLPMSKRSLLSSIAGAANLGSMFVVIKTYPDFEAVIGSAGTFWLYSLLSLLSCFFVQLCIPETKGKSFKEIEAIYDNELNDKRSNGSGSTLPDGTYQQNSKF